MMNPVLAAAFSLRLMIFWLCATGARCAGVVSAEGPVSLTTVSLTTTFRPPTSTLSSSNMTTTTSSSAVAPSSTQTTSRFLFNTISNMTTCSSGIITWNYSGSSVNLLLSVASVVDPYSSGNQARPQNTAQNNSSVNLANINATSNSWAWPQVNVSQGWYQGTVSPLGAVSAAFFISNGSDVSCLPGSSSSSSATLDAGKIIGIVLGILAGLGVIVVAAAYCYLRRCHLRRCQPPRRYQRRRETKDNIGRWGSLKSNPSVVKSPLDAGETSTAQSDATESTGESLADITGPVGEKAVSNHSPNHSPNHTPPSSYNHRTSLQLHSDYSAPTSPHHRRRSEQYFEQQANRIRSSMENSMHMRTERFSLAAFPRSPHTSPRSLSTFPDREEDDLPSSPMHTAFHRGRDEYPPSPVVITTPGRGRDGFPSTASVSRSPSASTATRRASRKPVPHFDPSELRDPKEVSHDAQPVIPSDDVSSSPHDIPTLSDKINFGDRSRMHYLIPDMPPPGIE